jgi:hypothetical protein
LETGGFRIFVKGGYASCNTSKFRSPNASQKSLKLAGQIVKTPRLYLVDVIAVDDVNQWRPACGRLVLSLQVFSHDSTSTDRYLILRPSRYPGGPSPRYRHA